MSLSKQALEEFKEIYKRVRISKITSKRNKYTVGSIEFSRRHQASQTKKPITGQFCLDSIRFDEQLRKIIYLNQ